MFDVALSIWGMHGAIPAPVASVTTLEYASTVSFKTKEQYDAYT